MRRVRGGWHVCGWIVMLLMWGHTARTQQVQAVRIGNGVTKLDEIGLYEVGFRYRSGKTGAMPLGWTGHFEDKTGISCTNFGTQAGKQVFLLHPIWRGGTGVTDQTFHLALPRATRITLRFAIAMKEGEVGPNKSDGATFRVFLNGIKLFDQNKTDAVWSDASFDLTPAGGKTVTLRFETDPGPHDNPSFDYAFWGDREIAVEGASTTAFSHPLFAATVYPLDKIERPTEGAEPPTPPKIFTAPKLITRTAPHSMELLGGWEAFVRDFLVARQTTSPPIHFGFGAYLELIAPDGHVVRSDSEEVHPTVTEEILPNDSGVRRTLTYHLGERAIRVEVRLYRPAGYAARVQIRSDDPYIAAVHFGDIGPVAYRRQIAVPYYGSVDYLPDLGLFAHAAIDHTQSQASALDGTTARYEPLTDGTRLPVQETACFALGPDLYSVLPEPSNPPSPYRALLGQKVVLDVWGGNYEDNAAWLRELASYRLTHLLTIVHDWQNGGYDNKLPDVLPAQERLGGDPGMKDWVRTATGLGESIGLHENYVDFYPNAPSYNEADVAHDSQGNLIKAWYNEGTHIQSFAVAPDAILKYAREITPEVHHRFGTNAGYLDVHSAVPPWFHVDFRADREGAGTFREVWNAHKDLWALFRETHGGPVLGEGNNHWYWSGLLDGVEAQFGTGVPSNGGQEAPLFVDFDLTAIHPLQFNHGMGYLERWLSSDYDAEWHSRIPTMQTLDQYRMQEVAYGHAGFIAAPLVNNLPFVWQEHNLMWPLTTRYATARPTAIRYEVGGKLLPTNAAIAAGSKFDRVEITYDNGLTIRANGRAETWKVGTGEDAQMLPQYGWTAIGKDLHAGTTFRSGAGGAQIVADYAETPTSLFVDARSTVVTVRGPLNVQPAAVDFAQTGARRFQIAYAWKVGEAIPRGENIFVHVTGMGASEGEGIVFQMGSGIAAPPETWPVGQVMQGQAIEVVLPATLADGVYQIRVGMYVPKSGERLALSGEDDGSRRIVVGTLTVANGGATLRFTPTPSAQPQADRKAQERLAHTNPKHLLVDFGKLATDGSLLLERQNTADWLLTPFPRDSVFTVRLECDRLDPAFKTIQIEALDENNHVLGPVEAQPLPGEPSHIRFQVNKIAGAVRYHLTNR